MSDRTPSAGTASTVEAERPPSLDTVALRRRFPVLDQPVHGHRLAYLDSAASSQKPDVVIDALGDYYRRDHANVHRGVHTLAVRATDRYEEARRRMARFAGAGRADEIVFTRSTTESINLVAAAWGRANLGPDDVVLVTEMEHHSNLVPWQLACEAAGAGLQAVRMTGRGELDLDDLDRRLAAGRVRLVATAHVSNALGTLHPVEEIASRARAAGALYLIDGAQAAPQMPFDVRAIGCDFYAFSGHKMCGPTGIGVLWGRKELLDAMPPYQGGGEMIEEVRIERSTYARVPFKFEAGTPHISGAIGLAVAADFLDEVGRARIHAHERRMAELALARLAGEFPRIRLHGPDPGTPRAGVISFTLADVHPHDLATILDHEGVAVRAGHHCCQPLMRRLGVAATARASFYLYNDEDDLEALVRGLHRAEEIFGVG